MNTKQNTQQNINRALPAMTAEAYFKHKEVIEAWLQGADIEVLDPHDSVWYYGPSPQFVADWQYRIKPANLKKYIIVGFDGDSHHTHGVWSDKVQTYVADGIKEMQHYNQQHTLIELEINPSNGKVVAAKVVE